MATSTYDVKRAVAQGARVSFTDLASSLRVLLLGASILVWLAVVVRTRIDSFGSSDAWGLASRLPWAFWVGLASLSFSVAVQLMQQRVTRALAFVEVVAVFLYLFATPAFIEVNPRFYDSYSHMGLVRTTLAYGLFPPPATVGGPAGSANPYVAYPGSFLYAVSMVLVPGVDPFQIMRFLPLLEVGISLVFIYILAKSWGDQRIAYATLIVYMAANWFAEFHFSPQAYAFPLFGLTMLALHRGTSGDRWVAVLLSGAVVIAHPGTTIMFLILLSMYAVYLSYAKRRPNWPREFLGPPWFLYVFLAMFASYNLLYSNGPMKFYTTSVAQVIVNIFDLAPTPGSAARLGGRATFASDVVFRSRELISALLILGALWAFMTMRKRNPRTSMTCALIVVSAIVFSAFLLFYASTVIERGLLFMTMGAPILAGSLILRSKARVILVVALTVAVVSAPVFFYGNEYVEYVSSSDLGSLQYVMDNFRGQTVLANMIGFYSFWGTEQQNRSLSINWLEWDLPDEPSTYNGTVLIFCNGQYLDFYLRYVGPDSSVLRAHFVSGALARNYSLVWNDGKDFVFFAT